MENKNADMQKQEREQVVELGSDITKSSKGNIYTLNGSDTLDSLRLHNIASYGINSIGWVYDNSPTPQLVNNLANLRNIGIILVKFNKSTHTLKLSGKGSENLYYLCKKE